MADKITAIFSEKYGFELRFTLADPQGSILDLSLQSTPLDQDTDCDPRYYLQPHALVPRRWMTTLQSRPVAWLDNGVPMLSPRSQDTRAEMRRVAWLNEQLSDILTSEQIIELTVRRDWVQQVISVPIKQLYRCWNVYLSQVHAADLPAWPKFAQDTSSACAQKIEQAEAQFNQLYQQKQHEYQAICDKYNKQIYETARAAIREYINSDEQMRAWAAEAAMLMQQIHDMGGKAQWYESTFESGDDLYDLIEQAITETEYQIRDEERRADRILACMNTLRYQLSRIVVHLQRTLAYYQEQRQLQNQFAVTKKTADGQAAA